MLGTDVPGCRLGMTLPISFSLSLSLRRPNRHCVSSRFRYNGYLWMPTQWTPKPKLNERRKMQTYSSLEHKYSSDRFPGISRTSTCQLFADAHPAMGQLKLAFSSKSFPCHFFCFFRSKNLAMSPVPRLSSLVLSILFWDDLSLLFSQGYTNAYHSRCLEVISLIMHAGYVSEINWTFVFKLFSLFTLVKLLFLVTDHLYLSQKVLHKFSTTPFSSCQPTLVPLGP
jgi:hypothetical protein